MLRLFLHGAHVEGVFLRGGLQMRSACRCRRSNAWDSSTKAWLWPSASRWRRHRCLERKCGWGRVDDEDGDYDDDDDEDGKDEENQFIPTRCNCIPSCIFCSLCRVFERLLYLKQPQKWTWFHFGHTGVRFLSGPCFRPKECGAQIPWSSPSVAAPVLLRSDAKLEVARPRWQEGTPSRLGSRCRHGWIYPPVIKTWRGIPL